MRTGNRYRIVLFCICFCLYFFLLINEVKMFLFFRILCNDVRKVNRRLVPAVSTLHLFMFAHSFQFTYVRLYQVFERNFVWTVLLIIVYNLTMKVQAFAVFEPNGIVLCMMWYYWIKMTNYFLVSVVIDCACAEVGAACDSFWFVSVSSIYRTFKWSLFCK